MFLSRFDSGTWNLASGFVVVLLVLCGAGDANRSSARPYCRPLCMQRVLDSCYADLDPMSEERRLGTDRSCEKSRVHPRFTL
jgi:hypothetical protein